MHDISVGSEFHDILGLRPFGSLGDIKLDALSFFQRAETTALDDRIMDEDIASVILLNESITLLITEPFYCALRHRAAPCKQRKRC